MSQRPGQPEKGVLGNGICGSGCPADNQEYLAHILESLMYVLEQLVFEMYIYICICICIYMYICICICIYKYVYVYVYIYIYIYIYYIYVYVYIS